METSKAAIERIVGGAAELRAALLACAENVHPNNVADDGSTTVQAALLDLRAAIDALLERNDPDNEITGEMSTE